MTLCKNCKSQLDGEFCSNCGQRDVDLARPTTRLVGDLLKETFDVDGRAYRTIKALFRHPGLLTNEFLAGRRRSYTSPIRLYLFISVTFFVLVSWLASRGMFVAGAPDPAQDIARLAEFMSDDLPRLMFVLLPIFALLLKGAFPGRLLFDHAIFSIHFHSAAYIVLALMLPLERVADEHWLPLLVQFVLFGYLLGYFLKSLRRVYRARWIAVIVKSTAVLLVYLIIMLAVIDATNMDLLPRGMP